MNELKQFGLLKDDILTSDYHFQGETKLKGLPLEPSGQWDKYLPVINQEQDDPGETNACTSFGTLNCIEILTIRQYGNFPDYSERYSAIVGNTDPQYGNSPGVIAESTRKNGAILEGMLPLNAAKTVAEFYQPKPMLPDLLQQGRTYLEQYKLGHEWVKPDVASIKAALTLSPLGVPVVAWFERTDLTYYIPPGIDPNHWVCLYGYDDKYWHILDSYPPYLKKLEIGTFPDHAKRYSLEINNDLSIYQQIVAALAQLIPTFAFLVKQKLTPVTPTPIDSVKQDNLHKFCQAIEKRESSPKEWCNPGALRFTTLTKSLGAIGHTPANFCIFQDYISGVFALKSFVLMAARNELLKYHNCTIQSFFNTYAPSNDANDPISYAAQVAQACGQNVNSKLADFLV